MATSIDQVVLYNFGGLNFACLYVVHNGVKLPVFRDLPLQDKPDAATMNAMVAEVLAQYVTAAVSTVASPAPAPVTLTPTGKVRARRRTKAEMEAARAAGEAPIDGEEFEPEPVAAPAPAPVVAAPAPAPVVAAPAPAPAVAAPAANNYVPYRRFNDNMRNAITNIFKETVPHMLKTVALVATIKVWQERLEKASIPCVLASYVDVEIPADVDALHPSWAENAKEFIEAQPEYTPF